LLEKVQMVLEKRKSFMQKSGTKKTLCRLRPRLLHIVLDVFLIVCLVVLCSAPPFTKGRTPVYCAIPWISR
jgi:hypothetical protein